MLGSMLVLSYNNNRDQVIGSSRDTTRPQRPWEQKFARISGSATAHDIGGCFGTCTSCSYSLYDSSPLSLASRTNTLRQRTGSSSRSIRLRFANQIAARYNIIVRTVRTGAIVHKTSHIGQVFVVESFAQSGTSYPARVRCMSSIAIINTWIPRSTQGL